MAKPSEKLAQSLEVLHKLPASDGAAAIRARDLSRTHRERLVANGFLQEVIKGWFIPSRPNEVKGESTAWFASFWRFCATYLEKRFGKAWSLSPEQSLSLHAGNWTVPRQLMVRAARAGNTVTKLPHGTSLLDLRAEPPPAATGADHWVAAAFMCAVKPKKTSGADIQAGTTIDQLIAQTFVCIKFQFKFFERSRFYLINKTLLILRQFIYRPLMNILDNIR